MPRLKPSAARVRAVVARHAGTIQGVGGAVCVSAGSFLVWGLGVALLVLGGLLLLGAWGSA